MGVTWGLHIYCLAKLDPSPSIRRNSEFGCWVYSISHVSFKGQFLGIVPQRPGVSQLCLFIQAINVHDNLQMDSKVLVLKGVFIRLDHVLHLRTRFSRTAKEVSILYCHGWHTQHPNIHSSESPYVHQELGGYISALCQYTVQYDSDGACRLPTIWNMI